MMKTFMAFGLLLGAAGLAGAQVSSINSARVFRQFSDDGDAVFSSTNNYPTSIVLSETNVDGDGSGTFANRDNWEFSNDSGATSFVFGNDTFFTTSMDVTLTLPTGATDSPRKEAGYLLTTPIGGQGNFIVNSDGHEVVAFGGPLPFYSFNANNGFSYNTGQTITLGMTYFLDSSDGLRKIIYSANGVNSPALAFTNVEQGIIGNATLGGYLQTGIQTTNPLNGGTATFGKISIAAPVPEPASMIALGLGAAGMLRRRRPSK